MHPRHYASAASASIRVDPTSPSILEPGEIVAARAAAIDDGDRQAGVVRHSHEPEAGIDHQR